MNSIMEYCKLCNKKNCPKALLFNGYKVNFCRHCQSSYVVDMPSPYDLAEFYNGFHPNLSTEQYENIKTRLIGFWHTTIDSAKIGKLSLLDIGGGGGFFAKAFEEGGFGKSTYIDIDRKSVDFAGSKLGVTEVWALDVGELAKFGNRKFDVIYSRHVIEHLIDPFSFIESAYRLLDRGGRLIIQCPNQMSMEYFNFESLDYLGVLSRRMGIRKRDTIKVVLTVSPFLGVDPPRHLWGFSVKGFEALAKKLNLKNYKIYTRSIADHQFSPYFSGKRRKGLLYKLLGVLFFQRGLSHLVLEVQKP